MGQELAQQRQQLGMGSRPVATMGYFTKCAADASWRGTLWATHHPLTLFMLLPVLLGYVTYKLSGRHKLVLSFLCRVNSEKKSCRPLVPLVQASWCAVFQLHDGNVWFPSRHAPGVSRGSRDMDTIRGLVGWAGRAVLSRFGYGPAFRAAVSLPSYAQGTASCSHLVDGYSAALYPAL